MKKHDFYIDLHEDRPKTGTLFRHWCKAEGFTHRSRRIRRPTSPFAGKSSGTAGIDQFASIILHTIEWFSSQQCFFALLNRTLREESGEHLTPWLLYLKRFTSALDRLPSMDCQTVYRDIKNDRPQDYREGEIVV